MSYRGMGGYRAGDLLFRRRRRPRRAGDMLDEGESLGSDNSMDDTSISDSSDESAGLDMGALPDLSGTGGSGFDLAGLGGAIQKYAGGAGSLAPFLGGLGGSAAAAGAASGVGSAVKRLARKYIKHLRGGGGYRRMNPGNFRALRRSMRRLQAFEHAARRVYQFTHPARHKSHFKFHRKRRR